MTVKELIEKLRAMESDTPVLFDYTDKILHVDRVDCMVKDGLEYVMLSEKQNND